MVMIVNKSAEVSRNESYRAFGRQRHQNPLINAELKEVGLVLGLVRPLLVEGAALPVFGNSYFKETAALEAAGTTKILADLITSQR